MNVTFGIMEEWPERIRDKKERYGLIADRSLNDLKAYLDY